MTDLIVSYRGRPVAGATKDHVFLVPRLLGRPTGDPEVKFVLYMAAYARDVLSGELPGPYSEEQALRYARAGLIPEEVYERQELDVDAMAAYLGMPACELEAAVREARDHQPA